MIKYSYKIKYYETDKMGITHHSNYIRFMEDARLELLDSIGCNYRQMEDEGIISPVVSVDCNFKKSTTYKDTIDILVKIIEFTGIRLRFEYLMINPGDDSVVCTAESEHCFVDSSFKPINLKKVRPELYQKILDSINQ